MFKNRQIVSFLLTVFLYLGIVLFMLHYKNIHVGTEHKIQEKKISFSLASYEPAPPVKELEETQIIEEPEPVTEPIVEPIVKEVEPEPIPEPIIEKPIAKPLPVVKKKKPKPKNPKKPKAKKPKIKKVVTKKVRTNRKVRHTSKKTASSHSAQVSPAKKNAFLTQLRAKINKHKTYPRIAQRRGMQGSVKVKFTIFKNGQVGNISIKGPKVFHTSARNAVKRALPINVKSVPLSLPITVNLTLRYQIR